MPRTDKANFSRYWWHGTTPGLSLLRADFTTHEYPPHMHEALVVAVTEQGGSIIRSRGTTELAEPSTLFVFNPVETHAGWMGASPRWCYRAFYLERVAIARLAQELDLGGARFFTRNALADDDLAALFLGLHQALERDDDPLQQRELMLTSFGQLLKRHAGATGARTVGDNALLRRAIDMMRETYAENPSLAAIAGHIGISEFQVIGLFKRLLGITPHAYLTQIRLNVACHHLRRGVAIAEAAAAAGFCDQSAMTRHFKRCYGTTPQQLARAAGTSLRAA